MVLEDSGCCMGDSHSPRWPGPSCWRTVGICRMDCGVLNTNENSKDNHDNHNNNDDNNDTATTRRHQQRRHQQALDTPALYPAATASVLVKAVLVRPGVPARHRERNQRDGRQVDQTGLIISLVFQHECRSGCCRVSALCHRLKR